MTNSDPTVLSAFSGVGGLDLGLEKAGFRSAGCIELESTARRSLKANRPGSWTLLDPPDINVLAKVLGPRDVGLAKGDLTLLAGAPPCQPYSKAAMWAPAAWNGFADERAQPLFAFLDLVERFLPRCVLLENVAGFIGGQHSATSSITRAFEHVNARHGTSYALETRVIDAADFGVPQRRRRAILVALRDGAQYAWPQTTFSGDPVRAWDALRDLDDPTPAPKAAGRWAGLLSTIPEGQNYLWHTNRGGGKPLFGYRTRYWSFLLKLAKALPSWTIPAQPGPSVGPFHWESRPLRTSELLRLQSFPPGWVVEGARREQVLQVGNATPPLLGEVLGRAILTTLDGASWLRSPKLSIERREPVPPPEPVRSVPARYRQFEGHHPAHPGEGHGPRPRSR